MLSSSPISLKTSSSGFTLVELLIAAFLTVLLVGGAFFGILVLLQSRSKAQVQTRQEDTLNLSLEFIGDDIRAASRVNRNDGEPITAAEAVAASAGELVFSPPLSPNVGTYVLYLEIPMKSTGACPSGAPPEFDRVIYDIRPSEGTWQGPNVIYRYGRLPTIDGTLDPCSSPTQEQALVEAIAPSTDPLDSGPLICAESPKTGVNFPRSGADGFWACINNSAGNLVEVKISSVVSDASQEERNYSVETQFSPRRLN